MESGAIAELDLIKKFNLQLKDQIMKIHNQSKKKVQEQERMISQLQKENVILKKQVSSYSKYIFLPS